MACSCCYSCVNKHRKPKYRRIQKSSEVHEGKKDNDVS